MQSPDAIDISIWQSRVNSVIALLFVGSCALGALFLVWHVAYGENPLANAIAAEVQAQK